jgi:hypothetical protein
MWVPTSISDKRKGGFLWFIFIFMYVIQHCFICRPSDSTVLEDAGFEPWTDATLALTVRRSNLLATSHDKINTRAPTIVYLIPVTVIGERKAKTIISCIIPRESGFVFGFFIT